MTLDQYLTTKGIRGRTFAGQVGVHPSKISRMRRGWCKPSIDLALKIRTETGGAVAPEDFVTPSTPTPPPERPALAA